MKNVFYYSCQHTQNFWSVYHSQCIHRDSLVFSFCNFENIFQSTLIPPFPSYFISTPEARQRLANLRLTKAELVNAIEAQLIQMAQAGRIQVPVTDATLKQILRETTNTKREIHITRK